MKALSVKQPFATALAYGEKSIEFRSKPTNHRGELLICASKSSGNIWFDVGDDKGSEFVAHPLGVMLGVRRLVECRPMAKADLTEFGAPKNIEGWFALVFDGFNDTTVPRQVKGSIGFFNVDDSEIEPIPESIDGGAANSFLDYEYPNKHDKRPKNLVVLDF